ncbi:ubiquinol oxidase subunit II [uncultured Paracoccus sp.]|uniref:ubiquinol oxidase subunit II n=1 Tax=uncultured Paracoccus sp. TaxID=189685 RepID=UPI002593396A|nr:ubiquinol oxidase subunit II [uncultured Paracoccus sp.]
MTQKRKFAGLPWLALAFPLAACKAEVLAPAGDVAARQRDLLVTSTLLMLLIIVPVMILTVIFALRYRARNRRADYQPDWDHSTKLEFVIWAAPLLIIITLGALTWVGTHLLDPYRPLDRITSGQPVASDTRPLQVQVVAMDWKWLFIYPEQGIASINEMAVPVDRPVEFTLTSTSVMNAFYIPAMAGMIYAMPGMETKLNGVFNRPGEYKGIASHYSGQGFSGMHFKALASDEAGFDAWVARARAGGGTLDRPRYLELEAPSENVPPMSFADVDPQLFQRVVTMCVEPGKICMAEMMALDAQGGTGLAGTMNVQRLTYDKDQRRGTRAPVLGWEPFQIASFCTPEDSARMFGKSPELTRTTVNMTPLRGHALPPPKGLFTPSQDNAVTLLDPTRGQAQKF